MEGEGSEDVDIARVDRFMEITIALMVFSFDLVAVICHSFFDGENINPAYVIACVMTAMSFLLPGGAFFLCLMRFLWTTEVYMNCIHALYCVAGCICGCFEFLKLMKVRKFEWYKDTISIIVSSVILALILAEYTIKRMLASAARTAAARTAAAQAAAAQATPLLPVTHPEASPSRFSTSPLVELARTNANAADPKPSTSESTMDANPNLISHLQSYQPDGTCSSESANSSKFGERFSESEEDEDVPPFVTCEDLENTTRTQPSLDIDLAGKGISDQACSKGKEEDVVPDLEKTTRTQPSLNIVLTGKQEASKEHDKATKEKENCKGISDQAHSKGKEEDVVPDLGLATKTQPDLNIDLEGKQEASQEHDGTTVVKATDVENTSGTCQRACSKSKEQDAVPDLEKITKMQPVDLNIDLAGKQEASQEHDKTKVVSEIKEEQNASGTCQRACSKSKEQDAVPDLEKITKMQPVDLNIDLAGKQEASQEHDKTKVVSEIKEEQNGISDQACSKSKEEDVVPDLEKTTKTQPVNLNVDLAGASQEHDRTTVVSEAKEEEHGVTSKASPQA